MKAVLIALDQLGNALIGGYPDESLSSHAWRNFVKGKRKWPKVLIDSILWFDKNHCEESYKSEVERRQCPPEIREINEG